MKNVLFATISIAILSLSSFAQSADEKEIMRIHKGLETAYIKGDVKPFETDLADYYTYATPNGKAYTRAEMLKEMRDEIAKPTAKNISEDSDNIKIHILGNTALVTASWKSVSLGLMSGDEPLADNGQYTGIYEKDNGKWMLVREVFTEAQHDPKAMEEGVLKASNAFDEAMRSRDRAAYERLLHADYIYTTEDGKLVSRDEELSHFADAKITTMDTSDKKIRLIGNSGAVETGAYHAVGSYKGKAFDETGRYTTTWIWKDLRWQVIADHNSIVTK
jgi:ketosteroid isomerase-like protein